MLPLRPQQLTYDVAEVPPDAHLDKWTSGATCRAFVFKDSSAAKAPLERLVG